MDHKEAMKESRFRINNNIPDPPSTERYDDDPVFTTAREEMDYRIQQAKETVSQTSMTTEVRAAFYAVLVALQEVADHAATRD